MIADSNGKLIEPVVGEVMEGVDETLEEKKIQDASASPVVKPKVVKIDFSEAMRVVAQGKKVTKLEWKDDHVYLFLKNGRLKIHKADNSEPDLIVTDGDMLGTDFVVIK